MQSKDLIYQVRKNLWSRGWSVKDMSDSELGFDLLVEGKHRVKVVGRFDGEFDGTKYDFVACAAKGTGAFAGKVAIRYRSMEEYLEGPADAFGLPTSKDKKYGKKVEGKEGSKKEGGAKE